uniref:DEAD/SNF2-like helicase n=1 Tax=Marseillevirus LCMAC101 TaxID=2506602 RepID=A0A481YS24_9VIRU|nr:MAG: DEAD/SNF2-like helicase [Marseillevirus LCMAC101]
MSGVVIKKVKPTGVTLYQDVLTSDQSEEFYGYLNQQGWENRGNGQEIQYYGYRYDTTTMDFGLMAEVSLYNADKFTKLLKCLSRALVKHNILDEKPNQITIVKYDPEEGGSEQAITYPYRMYGAKGAILSLGSDATMVFSPSAGKDINVKLPVGSIMTFEGNARSKYTQYISEDSKRGTYISLLFLTNSIRGKPYTKKVKKIISRKIRVRPKQPGGVLTPTSHHIFRRTGTCLTRGNIKLRDYQLNIVKYLETHRGVIAAYATGTGKTLIAITAAECYLDKNPDGRILIITPTPARDEFKANMEKYGISSKDNKYCFYGYQEFTDHYNRKNDTIKLGKRLDAGRCTSCKDVFLIVDEAHELRTPTPWSGVLPFVPPKRGQKEKITGIRAIRIIQCAAAADKVLLLTATPLVNDPYDIANLVAMVRGEAPLIEKDFYDLIKIIPRKPEEFIGFEVNEKFRGQIGRDLEAYQGHSFKDYFCDTIKFFKRPKDKYWPSEKEIWKPIEMDEEYYGKYYQIEKKKLALFRKHARRSKGAGLNVVSNPSAFYTIVSQATNSIEKSPKIAAVVKYIKNKKPGEKILIYSGFLEAGLDEIKKKLDARFYIKKEVKLPLKTINDKMNQKFGGRPQILYSWTNIKKELDKDLDQRKGKKILLSRKEISESIHDIIDEKEIEVKEQIEDTFKRKYGSQWIESPELEAEFEEELINKIKQLSRDQIEKAINFIYHEKMLLPLAELQQEAKDRRIDPKKIKGNTKQAYYEALRDYVEVTGEISKTKRKDDKEEFNNPDSGIDIMLISKAGGVALDLVGVRKVIMLESQWNRPGEDQVKGRAIRFKSHYHLPLSKQNVEVIHLILTKPGGPIRKSEADMSHLSEKSGFDLSSFKRPLERLSTINDKGEEEKDASYSADVAKLLLTFLKDVINKKFEADLINDC